MNARYFVQAGLVFTLFTLVPARCEMTVDFPAVQLRGYGTVSGSLTNSTTEGKTGSVLAITCEKEDNAKLLLAKFLSDEQTLPGVAKTQFKAGQWGISLIRLGGTSLTAYEAKSLSLIHI